MKPDIKLNVYLEKCKNKLKNVYKSLDIQFILWRQQTKYTNMDVKWASSASMKLYSTKQNKTEFTGGKYQLEFAIVQYHDCIIIIPNLSQKNVSKIEKKYKINWKIEFNILQFFCEAKVPTFCGTIYLCRSLRISVLL